MYDTHRLLSGWILHIILCCYVRAKLNIAFVCTQKLLHKYVIRQIYIACYFYIFADSSAFVDMSDVWLILFK